MSLVELARYGTRVEADLARLALDAEGINAVMGLHIEKALTHTAALPVAVNAQCLVGRRWRALISADNVISFPDE